MSDDSFYTTGGSLDVTSPTYVKRDADDELFNRVSNFEFCYVLTTRQMGKSSLMVRTKKRLVDVGWAAATVDLSGLGSGQTVTAEQWYYGICDTIAQALDLNVDLDTWWDQQQRLPLSLRLTRFLRDVVLAQRSQSIAVFVDEIDSTLKLNFSDDFFAAIRACYNARATDPEFKRLTFVLLGVASPSDLMQDRTRTPFNIGSRVELTDFTIEEAQPLANGLSDDPTVRTALLQSIWKWSGGHPYLTQALCAACRSATAQNANDVDRVVANDFLQPGKTKQDKNLSFVRDRLLGQPDLKAQMLSTYRRVLRGAPVVDEPQSPIHLELKLSGVLKPLSDGHLVVRNPIYAAVFDAAWLKIASPVNWAFRVATVAVMLLVVSPVGWYELIYPRSFINHLERAEGLADGDFKLAQENYEALRSVLFYQDRADQLWGEFNERRLESAIELDRITMGSSSPERQAEALKIATSACDAFAKIEPNDGPKRGASGMAKFHARRLAESVKLDEFGATAALDVKAGEPKPPLAIAQQRHAYQHALLAFDSLAKSGLPESKEQADLGLADFFIRRAERAEYAEQVGEGVLWRLRSLQPEDQATTRQAVTHLLSSDHTGLVRTWGETTSDSSAGSIILAQLYQDEKRLLIATSTGSIQSWALDSRKLLESFQHAGAVDEVILSKDERRILSWGSAGIQIWQFGQRDPVRVLSSPLMNQSFGGAALIPPAGATFNHDGSCFVTWSDTPYSNPYGVNGAKLWDVSKSESLQTFEHDSPVIGAAFNRDGSRVLTRSRDNSARLWDVSKPEPLQSFKHESTVRGAIFSRDESRVLTWSGDNTARLWDVLNPVPLQTFQHHAGVSGAVFSRDESRVLSWSQDLGDNGEVLVWNVTNGKLLCTLKHDMFVDGAVLDNGGNRVLTWGGSRNGTYNKGAAFLWNVNTSELHHTLEHGGRVYGAAFNERETRVLTWGRDYIARLWDVSSPIASKRPIASFPHYGLSRAVFSPDEASILTWSEDNTVRHWDVTERYVTPELPITFQHDAEVVGAVFSRDESRILTWSDDESARLWDVLNPIPLQTFQHDSGVSGAVFNRDETRVLTWSGTSARLWDVSKSEPIQTFRDEAGILGAALSRDENRVLTWGPDGTVRLWDLSRSESLQTFRHGDGVNGALFSRNENRVLTWGPDGTARLWDVAKSVPLRAFQHESEVNGAVFSDDESRVLSWSLDGTVRLWDVSKSEPTQVFQHDEGVLGAAFSSDETRVLTWDNELTVRLWNVSKSELLQTVRHDGFVLGAGFSRDESRIVTWTNNWLHGAPVDDDQLQRDASEVEGNRRLWSRRLPGAILNKPNWGTIENPFTVAQRWPDSRSVMIEHLRLDDYDSHDGAPIEGDPAKLLEAWQDKLGLMINNDGDIVPLRPIYRRPLLPTEIPVVDPVPLKL